MLRVKQLTRNKEWIVKKGADDVGPPTSQGPPWPSGKIKFGIGNEKHNGWWFLRIFQEEEEEEEEVYCSDLFIWPLLVYQ